MKKSFLPVSICLLLTVASCTDTKSPNNVAVKKDSVAGPKGSYGYDASFLKQYQNNLVELKSEDGLSKILIAPGYQGRVMTSTFGGDSGISLGWINHALIASGEKKKQFNPVGGEERFWMGPEGGQYSLYFKGGDSFNIDHWQVPPIIDTVTFDVKESTSSKVSFSKAATFSNYSGTAFDIQIDRTVFLIDRRAIEQRLRMPLATSVQMVAYETVNGITNTGTDDWTKEKGLISIWLLSMMPPSEQTKVIIPFKAGKSSRSLITDNYFGKMPTERLSVTDSVLYFTCDGKHRSKIGLSPAIAKNVAGSYDAKNKVLNILFLSVDPEGLYVNSKWELQKEPYKGDIINSYNDGPLADGSIMGPFYEIESSSSAKELKRGEKMEYRQMACHFKGSVEELNKIALQLLGVNLSQLK